MPTQIRFQRSCGLLMFYRNGMINVFFIARRLAWSALWRKQFRLKRKAKKAKNKKDFTGQELASSPHFYPLSKYC